MRIAGFYLLILFAFGCKSRLVTIGNEERQGREKVLQVLPGINNSRNSEGDFITLKNGKILFIYSHFSSASGSDFGSAYLAGRYSTDKGKTWSTEDQLVVKQEGDVNVMSVSLLRLKNGSIGLFYIRKNSQEDCVPMMRISNDEAKTWSSPVSCIIDRKGYFVLNNNRVIQLKNGRLLMPVALHKTLHGKWQDKATIYAYFSDDNGLSWTSSEAVPNNSDIITQEPGVVELIDGTIMMFIRASGGVQQLSYSKDMGETWSHIKPSEIKSPVAPASITRIPATGDLLLAWNNNGIDQKRTPLSIAISRDEGITWEKVKNIENDPDGSFCYTAIHFIGKNVFLGYWNRANKNKSSADLVRVNIGWIYD